MKLPDVAIEILENLKTDLAEYLNISQETLEDRLKPEWFNRYHGPQRYRSYGAWLRGGQYYLYDSTMWHWDIRKHLKEVYEIEITRSRKKVMDFGGSIGTRALLEAAIGNDVTLVEVNRHCLRYALWRAKKYGLTSKLRVESRPIGWGYDKILCIDVVGHLEQPEILIDVIKRLKPGGKLHITWDHLLDTPTHRNKDFDFQAFLMKHGMEKVTDNLWKRVLPGESYAESVWTPERIDKLEQLWLTQESLMEVKRFVDMCNRDDVKTVLDVGCGIGRFYEPFTDIGKDYTGIDIVQEMLRRARSRHPEGRFKQGSIFEIPFEDGSFDLVMAYDVLQHLDDYEGAISELKRVARKYIAIRLLMGEPRSTIGGWGEKIIFRSLDQILKPFDGWTVIAKYENGPNCSLLFKRQEVHP